ncbi:MAG: OPT family oligopeptide transporter [Deltaproteobacteria bacterium]|nr:OPT family oligopeptide transporter [Deltaproteobacteria bacterium]
MALFQKPATTAEEVEQGRPLDLSPDEVADFDEKTWYEKVYRGDALPQLTVRAVVMGSLMGFLLAFTNLYIGLKTGWGFGVGITACIMSYSVWNGLWKARLVRSPMSILETNCMQSTASSAGYSTGNTMVSAIAALLMLSVTPDKPAGQHIPVVVLVSWTVFIAILGVALAIPMKRNLINVERLKFPSGLAAATTLQSLYSQGGEAILKARALMWAAIGSGLTPVLMDLKIRPEGKSRIPLLPSESPVLNFLPARGVHPGTGEALAPSDWTMVLDHKLVLVAAGALVGLRICISMTIGGLALAYLVGPAGLSTGAVKNPAAAWREIGVWLGAPMMVGSGLLSFAFQWKSIVRSVRGGPQAANAFIPPAGVEVPNSWFWTLVAIGGFGIMVIAQLFFAIPWHLSLLGVAFTYLLALVACRTTGESDITPTGPMGKLVQLTYGVLIPQNATANLMTAGITSGAALSAADLLVDLKSGYLLGANPRRQFVAQTFGIVAGTLASVTGFYMLVPDASALLGTAQHPATFPAPAAQAWLAVARVFQKGIGSLHPMAQDMVIWGLVIGVGLTLLEKVGRGMRNYLPSATGLGLGLLLPFPYPLSMLMGALAAWAWVKWDRKRADRYTVALSSGIVAGESIVGVLVATLNNTWLR